MAANYGVKKATRKTYIPGSPGVPAYPGQPYLPARVVTTTAKVRVFKGAPSYKYRTINDILAGNF